MRVNPHRPRAPGATPRQKTTNPRKGIETSCIKRFFWCGQVVRKQRIPARGLKLDNVVSLSLSAAKKESENNESPQGD